MSNETHNRGEGLDTASSRMKRVRKDIYVLARFVEIYCRDRHPDRPRGKVSSRGPLGEALGDALGEAPVELCDECRKLLLHGAGKRLICPYDPKPRCKKCPTHCYGREYRQRIREVMRHSGMRLILRGRLHLLFKYFF